MVHPLPVNSWQDQEDIVAIGVMWVFKGDIIDRALRKCE